ncbi:ecdysone-induced protein 74EF [Cyclospora cayetanensis]|uniref:Ecdysone-induced protein 74EF n=1 Tax=Cyclospora cayetanensis TaxID=88456 RepID=A0A6P6RWA1_9EIME|nr:ecdysone-induced protein 74EF [Cyclospora cayetanensis]
MHAGVGAATGQQQAAGGTFAASPTSAAPLASTSRSNAVKDPNAMHTTLSICASESTATGAAAVARTAAPGALGINAATGSTVLGAQKELPSAVGATSSSSSSSTGRWRGRGRGGGPPRRKRLQQEEQSVGPEVQQPAATSTATAKVPPATEAAPVSKLVLNKERTADEGSAAAQQRQQHQQQQQPQQQKQQQQQHPRKEPRLRNTEEKNIQSATNANAHSSTLPHGSQATDTAAKGAPEGARTVGEATTSPVRASKPAFEEAARWHLAASQRCTATAAAAAATTAAGATTIAAAAAVAAAAAAAAAAVAGGSNSSAFGGDALGLCKALETAHAMRSIRDWIATLRDAAAANTSRTLTARAAVGVVAGAAVAEEPTRNA